MSGQTEPAAPPSNHRSCQVISAITQADPHGLCSAESSYLTMQSSLFATLSADQNLCTSDQSLPGLLSAQRMRIPSAAATAEQYTENTPTHRPAADPTVLSRFLTTHLLARKPNKSNNLGSCACPPCDNDPQSL